MGFVGVTNWPSVCGLIQGSYRAGQAKSGNGYFEEIEMIKYAKSRDMLTMPVCWTPNDCTEMAQAHPDVIIVHCGGTAGGFTGYEAMSMDDAIKFTQECVDAVHAVDPDILVLAHGGPIVYPKDFQALLNGTQGVAGFYGASAVERIPIEEAIVAEMQKFVACSFKPVGK